MLTFLRELFQHMYWADALVWKSVLKLSHSKNEPRFKELLYHIHAVQHVYFRIWQNLPADIPKLTDFEKITDLSRWGHEYHKNQSDFMDDLDESSLEELVNIPWADRVKELIGRSPSPVTVVQTMIQVISHSTYHRGQVNKVIRELDGEPLLVDFISWIWSGKPEISWPEDNQVV